jgi:hypothetical protein
VGQSGIYHGYFRSASGDQWVFEYRAQTQEGRLWGGDCQWEEPYPVQEGTCVQLIMAADERAWLQACWQAALSHFPPKA